MRTICFLAASFAALLFFSSRPAPASELGERIELSGFGGWAYAETDGNAYRIGTADGNYDSTEFALNIGAQASDRITFTAQVHLERTREDDEVEIDYAFGEYFVSDALQFRIGRVKLPFGIYGEIANVGTLRQFYTLPQGMYGPTGAVGKNYNGIGLRGARYGSSWSTEYDLFVGKIEAVSALPGFILSDPALLLEHEVQGSSAAEDAVGVRLSFRPPIEGLSFGGSAIVGTQGTDEILESIVPIRGQDRQNYGAHLQIDRKPFLLRAEFSRWEADPDLEVDGYYVEASYRIGERWEVSARMDWHEVFLGERLQGSNPDAFTRALLSSDDLGFGINYWLSPAFVLRLNYHQIEGNRFAFPSDPDEILRAVSTRKLENDTEMVLFGAQFHF